MTRALNSPALVIAAARLGRRALHVVHALHALAVVDEAVRLVGVLALGVHGAAPLAVQVVAADRLRRRAVRVGLALAALVAERVAERRRRAAVGVAEAPHTLRIGRVAA